MLLGCFEHSLDSKGRLSVPARFREYLDANVGSSKLLITRSLKSEPRYLEALPVPELAFVVSQIESFQPFSDMRRFLEDVYFGWGAPCEPDGQGRVAIPGPLREWAGLDKDAVVTGAGKRFRIWSRETWQADQSDPSKNDALAAELGKMATIPGGTP